MAEVDDKDIEHFISGISESIYDLNKKHSDLEFKMGLQNAMIPLLKFLKDIRRKNDICDEITKRKRKIIIFESFNDDPDQELVINHLRNEIAQLEKYL